MQITNLISGDRALNFVGQMVIIDHINKLEVIATYDPPKQGGGSGGMLKSFKSKIWGGKKDGSQLSDHVHIQIFQKALNGSSKEKVVVGEGSGSWLEYVQFDGKVLWTVEDDRPSWLMVNDKEGVPEKLQEYLLPSDSQLRADMGPLKSKDFEDAEIQKYALEELQRKDKRLRQESKKERQGPK